MTSKWRLASIEAEQFRGAAGRVTVGVQPGLTVLVGDNGAGKTSVCHAIEWTLFGKVPVLAGGEFQTEDAIANRITGEGGVSQVRLVLQAEGREASITRTRPRGSSSTRGASSVTVELDGKTVKGKDADATIAELVGVPPSEFSASVYLRQDTIADLVLGNEDLRSAAIDKLLGLGEVRELLENLQLGPIERAIRQLEDEVTSQRENVISAATMRRVQLARKREILIGRGLEEGGLSAPGVASMLEAARQDLKAAAGGCRIEVPEAAAYVPEVGELQLAAAEFDSAIQEVERMLSDRTVEVRQHAGRLQDLRERFNRAGEAAREVDGVDVEELTRGLAQLQGDTSKAVAEATHKRQLHLAVKPLCDQLLGMAADLESLRISVTALEGENLPSQLQKLDDDASATEALLQQQSSLTQLLIAAKVHLMEHPSGTCPLCDQTIQPGSVVSRIDQLIAQQGQQSANLAERIHELKTSRQEVAGQLEILHKDSTMLGRTEISWRELVAKIRAAGLEVTEDSAQVIEALAVAIERESHESSARQAMLEEEQRKLESRIRGVENARGELEAVRSDVQRAVDSADLPADVLMAITQAEADTTQRHQTILRTRQAMDRVRGRLATIREALAYLGDEKEVAELEQNVPPVERRIRQLTAAQARVLALRGAVLEVQDALTAVQDDALTGNLATLMPGVLKMFTALGGHPEFRQLVIEPTRDQKSGMNKYLLRAQSADGAADTFVQTSFSRGELNAVALSMFLAVAQASDANFAVVVLDDPSQSLDVVRKRALANVLREFAKQRQVLVATEDRELVEMLKIGSSDQLISLVHEPFQGTVAHTQLLGAAP